METLAAKQAREIQWKTLSFFVGSALLGLIGTPLYVFHYGLFTSDIVLFTFYVFATGLSITMGYHRHFTHVTYRAHPIVQFFYLFFGAAAFQQSALKWASQHRIHHLYTDTELDPYSMKKGFFHAHMGWLFFGKQPEYYENVRDLQKNKLVMHQHQYYGWWATVSGLLLPILIGMACGHGWGAFFVAVWFRLVFVHHSTFCINSFAHWIGKATYDPNGSAKDHWLLAILTFGEGYHSFHHRFPGDYRNGVKWYHWDPSKWLIGLMSFLKLTRDLKKVPPLRILHAWLAAENYRTQLYLSQTMRFHPNFDRIKVVIESKYSRLLNALKELEHAAIECRKVTQKAAASSYSNFKKIKAASLENLRQKQGAFRAAYQQWCSLVRRNVFAFEGSWV